MLQSDKLIQWSDKVGYLARVIIFDQFPRSVFRGTSEAFKYDDVAAELVKEICRKSLYLEYNPIQRLFLILALQHTENMENHQFALELASLISEGASQQIKEFFDNLEGFSLQHYEVISKFGRYPSRNEILGRLSTPEEIEWYLSIYLFYLNY